MTDTQLLDKLERYIWSDSVGNALAIVPSIPFKGGRHVFIQDVDMNDKLGSALTRPCDGLRKAIEELR